MTSWKNNRNGAIALNVGDVRFEDFKTADNILAGIEFEHTANVMDDRVMVKDSLIVGRSSNTESRLDTASPHGIIGPKTEYFSIIDTAFHNLDQPSASALGDCSHCFHPAATDSGARTIKTSGLTFVNTPKRIRHQFPYTGIFNDLDGSLTGKGANTYTAKSFKFNQQPECDVSDDIHDGVVCSPSVQIRRVAFSGATGN